MSNENLIVEHLRQHDSNHRDLLNKIDKISERQLEHEKTLLRNTITLEEHVKGSIATNKRLKHVEDQLTQVQDHVKKVRWWIELLKPTKQKILILATALSLATGGTIGVDLLSEKSKVKEIIQILNKENP